MLLNQILHGLSFRVISENKKLEQDVEQIVYNSQKSHENTLFVCLVGARFNGHVYAEDAYERGCRIFLVSEKISLKNECIIIQCDDTRRALSLISSNFFDNPSEKIKVIGVTGTKGKTTVASMLYEIFNGAGIKSGMIGTNGIFYDDIKKVAVNTTPESLEIQKTLNDMKNKECKVCVMEVSSLGVKHHRVDNVKFLWGIFTNLSEDHIGGTEHRDFEEYLMCKRQFFGICENAVGNLEDKATTMILETCKGKKLYYGLRKNADVYAEGIKDVKTENFFGEEFDVAISNKGYKCFLSLPGEYNILNSLAAITVASEMNVSFENIRYALSNIKIDGRSEILYMKNNIGIIVDFAHEAMSLKKLILNLRKYSPKRLIVLYGCVGERAQVRREGMGRVSGKYADLTIITTDDPQNENPLKIAREVAKFIDEEKGEYKIIIDRKAAIEETINNLVPGDFLALCGKGNEKFMKIKNENLPFDEIEIARKAIRQKFS